MRRLFHDRQASVEGLPLQLMIIAVVLAITVPLMFGALRTYDRSKVENELKSEINDFISTAQMVYVSGPGNRVSVEFHAADGAFSRIEYVKFGDAPGENYSSAIRYKIGDMQEIPVVLRSPNVPMMSIAGGELILMPGQYEIIVECRISETDLNNDGLAPDNFIQLSFSGV